MSEKKWIYENTQILAYMGDAAYEIKVREHVIASGVIHGDSLHRMATKYVKAEAQAKVIKKIFNELTEDEQNLVKRARNRKISSKAKNADPIDYKWATGFEALIGYYYLSNKISDLNKYAKIAIELTDKENEEKENE